MDADYGRVVLIFGADVRRPYMCIVPSIYIDVYRIYKIVEFSEK